MALAYMLLVCTFPVFAESADDEDEWTVLFYMCGSDLESAYGYATQNLEDIASVGHSSGEVEDILETYAQFAGEEETPDGRVNVVIETGGCRQWHAEKLGMDISTDALQRWRYEFYANDEVPDGFFLEQTLPLQSMARPETLSDFVRWGAENYPAKKYALVLWDHGGGSKTGMFIDELFDGDFMYLDELGTALKDSGVHLEAILFDACLMAGLETAAAVSDYADWMIASEELVAGKGTAVGDWLQQLIAAPKFNGEWLGRWICDLTEFKYSDEIEQQAQELLTWSVIDLDKIPRLVELVDASYASLGKMYADYPKLMSQFAGYMMNVEHYGTSEGDERMWDLAGLLYSPKLNKLIPAEIYQDMLVAVTDAVVYNVRGPGRSAARGISFCYAVNFDEQELEIYSRNCPMPHYLAFLDAISPWTAPDRVYQTVERLPEIDTLEEYRVTAKKVILEDNTPAVAFDEDDYLGAGSVLFSVCVQSEDTGELISYGTMPAYYNASVGENGAYHAVEPWLWPALEGQYVASYVVDLVTPGAMEYLGSIPIQIDSEKWYLRYAFFLEDQHYTVYGLWNGYDADSGQFDRNVKSLSQMAGQEYALLYPVHSEDYSYPTEYVKGAPQTIYRTMLIENKAVPPGIYYIQYVVYDMFMRPMPMEQVRIDWDGEKATLLDADIWQGEEELKVPDNYWK